ncbi:MAG: 4-(cytidine 5'-diphospho)-2-C-methyl-D-erythritol kinase [Actinomycetota bacterium]|nr:4-(cytidine 5'-diphospho)-2-C-methyl-D-erythritol kinase [Actinomycetota bacterium]
MIRLSAPAKLTLSLQINGIREDGYHLINAEMVSLNLIDEIVIQEGKGVTVTSNYLDQPWGFVSTSSVPDNEDNLASQALRLMNIEMSVHINKKIPPGTGLGGGSADAAAVLRWGGFDDLKAASKLGADIPFCLQGGRAMVEGIGEEISLIENFSQTFTLLIPPFPCSTSDVYAHWDLMGGPKGDNGNDLEPAAIDLYPELKKWRDHLSRTTGLRPRLAGSGSTWFVEGSFPQEGHHVVSTIADSEHEPGD